MRERDLPWRWAGSIGRCAACQRQDHLRFPGSGLAALHL